MNINDYTSIKELAKAPKEKEVLQNWGNQEGLVEFIRDEQYDEHVLIYSSIDNVFLHAVLVPSTVSIENDRDDLLNWSGNPFSSWGLLQIMRTFGLKSLFKT